MFDAPPSAFGAGVHALAVAGMGLGLGHLIAGAVLRRRITDPVTLWALALPGLAAFTAALLVVHAALGGRLLASPWITRLLFVGTATILLILKLRHPSPEPGNRRAALVAAVLVLGGLVVWGTPVFRMLPLHSGGDTTWHAGWAAQLLAGEATPAAPITGHIPNYYPWLFHSLSALMAHLTPGGRIYHSLGPLQILITSGTLLALFALGRSLTGRIATGAAAALFAGLAGGVGWVRLRGIDLVVDPREAGMFYGGDLLFRRSYNIAFNNLSPPFPRDLAAALLIGFLVLLVLGLQRQSRALLALAGGTLGLTGLAGGEAVFVGGGVAVLLALFPLHLRRRDIALAVLLPAGLIYATWLAPLVANYLRYGGFVNITGVGPVTLRPIGILVAWGIAVPLAVYGAWRWRRRLTDHVGARVVLAVGLVSALILLGASAIPGQLGEAFLTLGRKHRYWPLLHLAVGLTAALGTTELTQRLRVRWLRGIAVTLILVLAIPSPIVASLAIPKVFGEHPVIAASLRGRSDTVLSTLADRSGRSCNVAVPDDQWQVVVWAYTGHRLVLANWNKNHQVNRARVRWRDMYKYIPDDLQRRVDNRLLTHGTIDRSRWETLVDRYRVDAVLIPTELADRPVFAGHHIQRVHLPEGIPLRELAIVWTGNCQRDDSPHERP